MSDAPVLNMVLKTVAEVDECAARISRLRPSSTDERFVQVVAYYWKPAAKLSQKNLGRAWSSLLAKHAGMDAGEMWRAICRELLGEVEVIDPFTRRAAIIPVSSTTLRTKEQWTVFNQGIERLARDHYEVSLPALSDAAAWLAFRGMKNVAVDK